MRTKTMIGVIAFLLVAMCLGCSTKNVGLQSDPTRDVSRFTLDVDAATFLDGASAGDIYITTEELDTHMLVNVNARGAEGLKALCFELEYDPDLFRPMTVAPTEAMGELSDLLTLHVFRNRGEVHYGQVLTNPEWRVGASGDVTLATVSFRKEPCPPTRVVSTPPDIAGSGAVLEWDDVAKDLNWRFASIGDCNQNGVVEVSDITPLGQNWDERSPAGPPTPFPYDTWESVVDGNSDGAIIVTDITPIGFNFGKRVLGGYNVYGSDDMEDVPVNLTEVQAGAGTFVENVEFSTAVGTKTVDRIAFTYDVAEPPPFAWYWVVPVDSEGAEGWPSNGIPTNPVIQPVLSLTNPPASGAGTAADPWRANVTTPYIFQLVDPTDGDVSNDPLTTYTVSNGAGTIDTADATLDIENAFEGDFTVTATYNGMPNRADTTQYMRVTIVVEGLYIMKDPTDTAWDDVVGSGVLDDEYVIRSAAPAFNVDYLTEFSLVANTEEDGSGDSIDVATLVWDAWPPFAVQDPGWATPGVFQANADGFTGANNYVWAVDGLDESNYLYITALDTLP